MTPKITGTLRESNRNHRPKKVEKKSFFHTPFWQFSGSRNHTGTKLAHATTLDRKTIFSHFFSVHLTSKKMRQLSAPKMSALVCMACSLKNFFTIKTRTL
jgi:hypothetical protein